MRLHRNCLKMRLRDISCSWQMKLLLTCLMVLTPFLQPSFGHRDSAICRFSCCTAQPNCQKAETIICSCPHIDKMVLKAGDIPTSVNSITLSQLKSLTIEKDALYSLYSLKDVSLHDIEDVIVERNGLDLQFNNSMLWFSVTSIHFFLVESHAFSGEWKDEASILLQDVSRLVLATKAFSYKTVHPGPQITIQNVTTLDVAPGAFDASIRRLELDEVSMRECRMGIFTEKTLAVVFYYVTVSEVKTGCFHDVGRLGIGLRKGIFISSSSLGTVDPQAFSGDIQTLEIRQNTEIDTVREQGFQATVKDFSMIQSKIGTLYFRGLNISATHKLSLSRVNVNHLHKDAFMGVRIDLAHRRNTAVNLDRLEVEHAEVGSLALPPCLLIDVSKLHIQAAYSERCPTEKWARRLLGADDHRALHSAEFKVFLSLRELDQPCDKSKETLPEMTDQDEACSTLSNDNKVKTGNAEKHQEETEEKRRKNNVKTLHQEKGKKQEKKHARRQERDAYDISYEYDEYWSEEDNDEDDAHPDDERGGRPARRSSGASEQPSNEGVSSFWKIGTLTLVAIIVGLVPTGVVLWWCRRKRSRDCTTFDDHPSGTGDDSHASPKTVSGVKQL